MGSKKKVSAPPTIRKAWARETLTLDVDEVLAWLKVGKSKRRNRELFHLGALVVYACVRRADSSSHFDEDAAVFAAGCGFNKHEKKELLAFLVKELRGGGA